MTLPRAIFMGTPKTAVPTLKALASISKVGLVVTRPDRPRGRSRQPVAPPIKDAAMEAGFAVAQPANRHELLEKLSEYGPFDIGVVAAYGMLLPSSVLSAPRQGFVNVHFSLLPRWRGASPVVAAISAGDRETGVSLMQMDIGLDTGPVIAATPAVIGETETGGELADRLAVLGAHLVAATLAEWMSGAIEPVIQDETRATYAPALRAGDRYLDPTMPPEVAARRVRALAPQPGAILRLDGVPHQILAAAAVRVPLAMGEVRLADDDMIVGMTDGALRVQRIQAPGGRPLDVPAWLRGRRRPPIRAWE